MTMITLASLEKSSSPGIGLTSPSVGGTARSSNGSIALDQWRGFALILVLFQHALFFTNRVNGLGRIGVNLFFFISGILVYRSLHKEEAVKSGWQLARSFWWRRFRRLYPALIAYVLTMLVPVACLEITESAIGVDLRVLHPYVAVCIDLLEQLPSRFCDSLRAHLECVVRDAVLLHCPAHLRPGRSRCSAPDAGFWRSRFGVGGGWFDLPDARTSISSGQISLRDSGVADGIRCFLRVRKTMVLRNPAKCGQVYLCIWSRRIYDRRHCHVVWNGSKKACNCHRWIAVVSVPVKLFIWLYCPGSDGALARLVRRENLFDLSMATAVYDLRVPSPYVRAFGGRRLNPRWGVVVSDFRKALPKCAPDFLSSCCGTSGAGRPVSRGTCDIGLNLTVGQMFRPFSLSALAIWFV